jgi:predicted dehydrogenase
MGRNLPEAQLLHAHPNAKNLSIGFNYRFMSSVYEAKQIVESRVLGEIHTIRMDLGHGGSPNDKNSWKLDPQTAGGGVILDPGIHLLDLLFYLFSFDTSDVEFKGANSWSGFWGTGIEEALTTVGSAGGANLNLSVSVVAWKTRFEIEIIGTEGYLKLTGRGRTDGPQNITQGQRWGWLSGKSQIESEVSKTVSITDDSLAQEVEAWLLNDPRVASTGDALRAELLRNQILDLIQE